MPLYMLLRIMCLLAAGYVVMILLITVFQYRLLYHPVTCTRAAAERSAVALGLSLWPNDTSDIHGYISQSPPDNCRGTILVFHGNAGNALDRAGYVSDLQPLGFRVILAEYPAYGPRPGRLGETSLVMAGKAAARAARSSFGEPLYVLGESLGSGIACAVAADASCEVSGVFLITPWDRLPDLAQDLYRLFPARYLVRDTYDNIKNLQSFDGRIAIVMAECDELIPNRRTQTLVQKLQGRCRLWTLEDVGHNDWIQAIGPNWWQEVTDYLISP